MEAAGMPRKIEISHRTIIFTVLFLILLCFLYQIRQILLGLFVSLILMAALNPTIDRLEKVKIPRALGIFMVYLVILLVLGLVMAGVIPPLVDQTAALISRLPRYLNDFSLLGVGRGVIEDQISQLGSIPGNLLKISVSIFTNLISIFFILVVTFYLLLERKNLKDYLHLLFAGDDEEKAERLISKIEKQLGGWVRAQLFLMLIIGLMSYFGLRFLGIDFALPLALLAGLLEVVPNIGPTVASIPAILAGLAVHPWMALGVAALYILIQQLENSIIVPQVMARGVGVNPLITLLSLAIGFEIGGVAGAVLAVPMVVLIKVVTSEFLDSGRFKNI